jgi:hypothetical protein
MPRRHPRTYLRPKAPDERSADLLRVIEQPERAADDDAPPQERPSIDYRPIVAVIAIVILSLAFIAFLLTLRAGR